VAFVSTSEFPPPPASLCTIDCRDKRNNYVVDRAAYQPRSVRGILFGRSESCSERDQHHLPRLPGLFRHLHEIIVVDLSSYSQIEAVVPRCSNNTSEFFPLSSAKVTELFNPVLHVHLC